MNPVILRRAVLLSTVLLSACGTQKSPSESLPEALPVQVQREWRLHDATIQPLDQLPPALQYLRPKAWVLAHYQANGTVTVRLIEPAAKGVAFEAMQKWHDPNALGFFKDDYFGTAEADKLSREELAGFVQDLQQNLKTK